MPFRRTPTRRKRSWACCWRRPPRRARCIRAAVAFGISALLIIVVLSYRQIIFAYPDGGGAYPVSRDNLGTRAALIAGASLLIDYVLTVSVSVAAGVAAIITAVPSLHEHLVSMCIIGILVLTLANLRGVKEAGWLFAGPSYLFIGSILLTIVAGLIACATHSVHAAPAIQTGESFDAAKTGLKAIAYMPCCRHSRRAVRH